MPENRASGHIGKAPKQIGWDDVRGCYTDSRGRAVSWVQVRGVFDSVLERSGERMKALTRALREGTLDLDGFRVQMAAEVKRVHLQAVAMSKGGWLGMSQADYGRAGLAIREEYAYLRRFVSEIASGRQRLDGTLSARAVLYAEAARRTFQKAHQKAMAVRGAAEEANVLGPADHCPQCLEQQRLGWVPLGTLVVIGERICKRRCKCHVIYRDARGKILSEPK